MAAKAQPAGSVPEKFGKSDVKASEESSPSDADTSTETEIEASADSKETTELDDSDLKEFEEETGKVPYSRFKEKNEEAKTLKEALQAKEREYQEALKRAELDVENRVRLQLQREQNDTEVELDPYEKRIKALTSEIQGLKSELKGVQSETEKSRLNNNLEKLKAKYPEADEMAVLGWARAQGSLPSYERLDELMEQSQKRNLEFANRKIKELIDRKKQKKAQAIPTRSGGIRLKESERPKTVKEASALLKRLVSGS
jgi:hypothetical protein